MSERRRPFEPDPAGETEAELSFHLEMRVRDYMRAGMSEADARAAARARLGDMDRVRTACATVDDAAVRDRRRLELLSEIRQDVRYGARMLARAPGFAATAVLTLALSIGAATAVFSLARAVLLAPLPYSEPDRVVRLWETSPQGNERNVISPANVLDWQMRARSFSQLGAHRNAYGTTLTGDGDPALLQMSDVQPSVFAALGVKAAVGRTFVAEDAGGSDDVVVLSHALWQRRYGGTAAVIGRRIVLNDIPRTVVGVMPADFAFPHARVDVWRVLRHGELNPNERTSHNFYVIGRLADGVSLTAAQAEMTAIASALAGEYPQFMTGWSVNVAPLHADLTRDVRPLLTLLLTGVALVLLIACGNLASLLFARAVARQRELAVRGALGASRARVARQLLTESVLLAGLGGVGALLLAPVLLQFLVTVAPADIPLLERAAIGVPTLLFVGAVALSSALLFGSAPALRVSRADIESVLRSARSGSRDHKRIRGALLVAQFALSVVLLVGAGLLIRSFAALQSTQLGFAADGLVIMEVDLPRARYSDIAQHIGFYDRLVERVRTEPGVVAAAATIEPPGGGYEMTFSFAIEGRPASNPTGREDPEQLRAITPGYFETLGQHVVLGRGFDDRDRAGNTPVAIINQALARKHWGTGNPLGRRIAFRVGESPWLEIVGVVADVRLSSPDVEPVPAIYIPYAQKTWPWMSWLSVLARVAPGTDEAAVKERLRRVLLELDGSLAPQGLSTVSENFRAATARRNFAMTLIVGFGVIALLLTIVGLYGLLSYIVAQQQREIGVRLALGEHAGRVVRGVLARALMFACAGALSGILIAAAAARLIEGLLYGVAPLDAATYGCALLVVVTTALLTAAVPAWRAARTSPLQALRSD